MRKKRSAETAADRSDRLAKSAQDRVEQSSNEEQAIDAAIRLSIKLHGA